MLTLSCPHCNFSKELPAERIPPQMKSATCPRCKKRFSLESVAPVAPEVEAERLTESVPASQSQASITCPKCGEQKAMPGDRLPSRKVTLRCQACAHVFDFEGRRRAAGPITHKLPPAPLKTAEHPVLAGRPAGSAQLPLPRRRQLSGTAQLLGKAWRDCLRRMPTLLGLNLIALPLAAIAYLILTSGTDLIPTILGDGTIARWLVGGLHCLFVATLASWVGAANILAVSDDELGAFAVLLLGAQRFTGFFRVFFLSWLVVAGGLVLLILPGLLLAMGFGLAPLVHLREDRSGLEALLKSRAYAKQRPAVYGRLILPGFLAGLTTVLLLLAPPLGLMLLVPLTPLGFAYLNALYDELEECGDPLFFSCSLGEKAWWLGIGVGGCLLALLLAVGVFGPVPPQALSKVRQLLVADKAEPGRLELPQSVYAPGEILTATFAVPVDFPRDAWVGVVPSRIPHGEEAVNQRHVLTYQHLEGRTRGVLHFRVPVQPGEYDLRLHDQDLNGRETASVSFRVVALQ